MGFNLFSNKNYNTGYKQRPFDSYKSVVDSLDEDTKRKLDRRRQIEMICIVAFVVLFIVVLAVTGIGVDKTKSVSGNVFTDKETVLIECFGDSLTEGYSVFENGTSGIVDTPYPKELQTELTRLLAEDDHEYLYKELSVKNYGQSGSILKEDSCGRLSGEADIVVILYTSNNFFTRNNYEGTLEANIETIREQGSEVFLLNYPYRSDLEGIETAEQCNNYISSAANSENVTLIDLWGYFSDNTEYMQDELFSADGEHLTQLGYILMGDYVADQIHQYYYDKY